MPEAEQITLDADAGDAGDLARPGGLSERAYLLLLVYREVGRVIVHRGDANFHAQKYSGARVSFGRDAFREAFVELEDGGYVEREHARSNYLLTAKGRGEG